MHTHLARWIPENIPHHRERALYTVASLIAYQPDPDQDATTVGNLGASAALLSFSGTETRLRLVTKQPMETVFEHVTRFVVTLRSNDIAVHFPILLDDLCAWPFYGDDITKRWLRSYARWVTADDDEEN